MVIKVLQAISGEMVVEKLADGLMRRRSSMPAVAHVRRHQSRSVPAVAEAGAKTSAPFELRRPLL
jgi:hypothetical protein